MAGGAAAEPVRRAPERFSGLLVVAVVAILVTAVATIGWMWFRTITFPYPVDYGEGPLLNHALRIASAQPAYPMPGSEPPWIVLNYGPVYPALNAGLSLLFGPAFWYGRLLSALGALAAALFAGLIVHTITEDRAASVITALLMPVVPCLAYWAALARVDLVALAASLAGVWCVVRRPGSTRWLVAGAVLMVLAACTRQSYLLAAPLTATVWLWPLGRRRAVAFAGTVIGSVLVLWAIATLATRGAFWFNTITANVNELYLELLAWYAEGIVWTTPVLLAVLLVAPVVTIATRQPSARLLVPYTAAALVVFGTAGKVGSSLNYLLELGTASCLAAGLLLAAVRPRPVWRAVVVIALLAQSLYLLLVPHPYYGLLHRVVDNRVVAERIAAVVSDSSGPVLADEDSGYLPVTGHSIELQPFELSQLSYAGLWDQTPLLDAIRQHRYAVILIYENDDSLEEYRWTPEMLSAVRRSYAAVEIISRGEDGRTVVYRPR